jgi:DNA primase
MGLIADDVIQQVLERTDIVDLVSEYVSLKQAGRNFKGISPFTDEKTPSFIVSPDKQIFHCFSSGVGGNAISFLMKMDRLSFPEAIRILAKKANVVIPENSSHQAKENEHSAIYEVNRLAVEFFHERLLNDSTQKAIAARAYLKTRGFNQETIQAFELGYAPDEWEGLCSYLRSKGVRLELMETAGLVLRRKDSRGYFDRFRNRLMFPILDAQGRCRAFGARAMDDASGAKYINSPETQVYVKGQHLYGFHQAKNVIAQQDQVIVVEGYIDCITPVQSGVKNIVASLGTALTVEQIRLLRRYTRNMCLLFDSDRAGEAAMLRSFDLLINEDMRVTVASLEKGEDPDSFIRKFGVEEFSRRVRESRSLFDFKLDHLLAKVDVNSVDARVSIVMEMLSMIRKFPGTVARAGYCRQLASRLNIPEVSLFEELQKKDPSGNVSRISREKRNVVSPVDSSARPKVPSRVVERDLLKLILEDNSMVADLKNEIFLDDFRDPLIHEVMKAVYLLDEQDGGMSYHRLLEIVEGDLERNLVTRLVMDDSFIIDNMEKMKRDCVQRMKQDRLRQQRQDLLRDIKEAERIKDEASLEMLKIKLNNLIKQAG